MPATITHAYFAEDVYNRISDQTKQKISSEKKSLMMFAQSTDSLMFYNITNFKKGKKIRALQYIFHSNKVNLYFNNLLTYTKENNFYNNPQVLSFIYGMVCHYSLDTTCHPYIFYKTGNFNKKDKTTHKYNSLHTYMETYIDNYFIKERVKNISKFKISEFCFDLKPFNKELNTIINNSFYKTYKVKNMDKIYYTSLKQMKNFLTLFRFDKYGIKNIGYKTIDTFTPKYVFKFHTLSYKTQITDKNYLNTNNKEWCYPVNKNIKSTLSFEQLYNKAVDNTINIINNINDYFYNNKQINIDKLFKNKSYITGIDCDKNLVQKYFEF